MVGEWRVKTFSSPYVQMLNLSQKNNKFMTLANNLTCFCWKSSYSSSEVPRGYLRVTSRLPPVHKSRGMTVLIAEKCLTTLIVINTVFTCLLSADATMTSTSVSEPCIHRLWRRILCGNGEGEVKKWTNCLVEMKNMLYICGRITECLMNLKRTDRN